MAVTVFVLIVMMFEPKLYCDAVVCEGETASKNATGVATDCGNQFGSCTALGKCMAYPNGTCYSVKDNDSCGEMGITKNNSTTPSPTAKPTDKPTAKPTDKKPTESSSLRQSQLPFVASLLGLGFILSQV